LYAGITTTIRFPAIIWMALPLLKAIQCKGAYNEGDGPGDNLKRSEAYSGQCGLC
jgi:hypothetical protein